MWYKRVVVKLSGGALAGDGTSGFDPASLNHIASEVLELHGRGVELGVVVGGGNIFRGKLGDQWGIEPAEADNIGMMATVANSLMLRGVLKARSEAEIWVRSLELQAQAMFSAKQGTDGVYTADPQTTPDAKRYRKVHYDTVIEKDLQALDSQAVMLAKKYSLPIHVFGFDKPGVMCRICEGKDIGTLIHHEGDEFAKNSSQIFIL